MAGFADLNYIELDALPFEEKRRLLNIEYDLYEEHYKMKKKLADLEEDSIIDLLNSVMSTESNHQITQNGEYPAKRVGDILHHSDFEETQFIEQLKILYLNDYIEYIEIEEFDVNMESEDHFVEGLIHIDPTYQLRYNLHRLFRRHKELFNLENFTGLPSTDSEVITYNNFLFCGTILDKICYPTTLIRLSNKGMHYLHFVNSKKSTELMQKQESLLNIFEEHKNHNDNNIRSINTLIKNHSIKINNFYKDITTIISLMLAAFALIGVNISAIPRIESNFTANLLAMNLSLILCMLVLFYILRVIVYDTSINNKHFYTILSITIIGIISVFVFLGFNNESKPAAIEKKYKQLLKDYNGKEDEKISKMEKQIELLENQLKKENLK